MADLLNQIITAGGMTAHRAPFDARRIVDEFISPDRVISCLTVEKDGSIIGFQALEWIDPNWPGEDRLPEDWAFISTHVRAEARTSGVGRALFDRIAVTAHAAGVRVIEASILEHNAAGLAF